MIIFLKIIGYAFIAFVSCITLACFLVGLRVVILFEYRKCKYCNHRMSYKGLRGEDEEAHYLFHCPKCGAWEQVPREKILFDETVKEKQYENRD